VAYVDFLSRHYQGKPAKTTEPMDASLWSSAQVPEPVAQKSASVSDPIGVDEWRTWQEHQRYALYKSALSKNQPEAFIAVLDELRASLGRRAQADD
ncbi:MAG TPA: nitrate reductase associated protein, partial [Terriglobales bacterium]|nr:nitrate reductase associated protein [Terriglobales bacterium]